MVRPQAHDHAPSDPFLLGEPTQSDARHAIIDNAVAWQADTAHCTICRITFGDVLNRRHHCRMCGKCVCYACSDNWIKLGGDSRRVCATCVANHVVLTCGAGASDMLPRLRSLSTQLYRLTDSTSPKAVAVTPAQALRACEGALPLLCETFADATSTTVFIKNELSDAVGRAAHSELEMDKFRFRCVAAERALREERHLREEAVRRWQAEAEDAERERRARALAEARAEAAERDYNEKQKGVLHAEDSRLALAQEELAQERTRREELESKLLKPVEAMHSLDKLLRDLVGSMTSSQVKRLHADAVFATVEARSHPMQDLMMLENLVASCNASAGHLSEHDSMLQFSAISSLSESNRILSQSTHPNGNALGQTILCARSDSEHVACDAAAPTTSAPHIEDTDATDEAKVSITSSQKIPVVTGSADPMGRMPSTSSSATWEPNARNCAVCSSSLGKMHLRRKHHCRMCGRCVCSGCSPSFISLPNIIGGQHRVCTPCASIAGGG